MALCVQLRHGERVFIGDDISIQVLETTPHLRLLIGAPQDKEIRAPGKPPRPVLRQPLIAREGRVLP